MRLTSAGLIGLDSNITSKDVTRSFKMAVIRTFFNSDTGEIMGKQESERITTTQVTYTEFSFHTAQINRHDGCISRDLPAL